MFNRTEAALRSPRVVRFLLHERVPSRAPVRITMILRSVVWSSRARALWDPGHSITMMPRSREVDDLESRDKLDSDKQFSIDLTVLLREPTGSATPDLVAVYDWMGSLPPPSCTWTRAVKPTYPVRRRESTSSGSRS